MKTAVEYLRENLKKGETSKSLKKIIDVANYDNYGLIMDNYVKYKLKFYSLYLLYLFLGIIIGFIIGFSIGFSFVKLIQFLLT